MGFGSIKIDQADKYFALWIKTRDKWTCQRCMKQYPEGYQYLQNSHFQGRRKESTRFDPENCDALCASCHQYFTSKPGDHYMWQVAKKGQKTVNEIIVRSNQYSKKDRKMQALIWKKALKDIL